MTQIRRLILAGAVVLILCGALAYEIIATAPVRGAVRTFSALLSIANRPGMKSDERLAAARALCTGRYLVTHRLEVARSGEGLVGLPRNLHKNFRGWREGSNVWICPTNRIGPVYQFAYEDGDWRFDGPVGIIGRWGELERMPDQIDSVNAE